MDLPFDLKREHAALAEVREREEEDVAKILSEKYGLPYVNLSTTQIDAEALRSVPEQKAREAEAAPFARSAKHLSLAVHNPNNPALHALVEELATSGFDVKRHLVSARSLERVLARYADLSFAAETKPGVFEITPESLAALTKKISTLADLRATITAATEEKSLARVSKILEAIFAGAFALKASDIHFEPEEGKARLRLRLDGLLTDIFFFEPLVYKQINSRLKLLSGVKLNVANRAQDGRFAIMKGPVQIDVRASYIPGSYGEGIVFRLLDPASINVSLKDLGIHPKLLARLETEIRRSNGMLLTTGPTGSGKTTTLYSFLKEIHTPDIKIITIEDPVEYHLDGIVQTQVETKKYTFADGLRSIVRQDPDVIMVGEIRDGETAGIAIEASLTGHFVFSTLHTNNAAGTFPRLVDLGMDPKSFGSSITVSMAQRLVRKLHPEKRKQRALTDAEKKTVDRVLAGITDTSLIPENTKMVWDPAPESEDETGYKGRSGLYEGIFMDDELAAFLREKPSDSEIATMAAKQGYLTMAQDGVVKALQGVTSLEEVSRMVDLPRA
ncbi:MAG TPA: GspE/PulE family protein [Candidatus Paceibacterota bacterium]|nr:GspE/PulE family protein [Candidatus Paceibacterota bacterium]